MTDVGNNKKSCFTERSYNINESAEHSKSIYLVSRRCYVWHCLKINS